MPFAWEGNVKTRILFQRGTFNATHKDIAFVIYNAHFFIASIPTDFHYCTILAKGHIQRLFGLVSVTFHSWALQTSISLRDSIQSPRHSLQLRQADRFSRSMTHYTQSSGVHRVSGWCWEHYSLVILPSRGVGPMQRAVCLISGAYGDVLNKWKSKLAFKRPCSPPHAILSLTEFQATQWSFIPSGIANFLLWNIYFVKRRDGSLRKYAYFT